MSRPFTISVEIGLLLAGVEHNLRSFSFSRCQLGEWGYVSFFRTEDLDGLERAIGDICLAEGLQPVPYARRERDPWDKMQYGTGVTTDRWAIAFGAGRAGWSVATTAPFQLLAEPGVSGEHRLGTLARVLRCEALYVELQDTSCMVMAEAAPTGQVVLSGINMDGPIFHDIPIPEERFDLSLECTAIPQSVRVAFEDSYVDGYFELLDQLADRRWHDLRMDLIEGLEVPSVRVLSFARPGTDWSKPEPLREAGQPSSCRLR